MANFYTVLIKEFNFMKIIPDTRNQNQIDATKKQELFLHVSSLTTPCYEPQSVGLR